MHLQTLHSSRIYVEQKCHFLVTTLYNINLACQLIKLKENLKYWVEILSFYLVLCALRHFCCDIAEETSMFGWGVLKRGVQESVRFCTGDLPMYTFLVPTHP